MQSITLSEPTAVTQGTFAIADWGLGSISQLSSSGSAVREYVATFFTADETRNYVFGQTSSPTDTVMILYNGTFDSSAPGRNAIVLNDDTSAAQHAAVGATVQAPSGCGSTNYCPQVSANLTAGQVVTLVVTTFSASSSLGLPQTFYANGPGLMAAAPPSANTPPTGTVTVNSPSISGIVTGTVNAVDADSDPLTYTASTPAKGAVAVNGTGDFTYAPSPDARHAAAADGAPASALADEFTITVTDGHGGNLALPVAVAVSPANTVPIGTASVNSPTESGVVTGNLTVTDADLDALSYSGSAAGKGTAVVNPDGSFTYTPTATARHTAAADGTPPDALADAFTVTATDGHGGTVAISVAVAVSPANAAPTGAATVSSPNPATGTVEGALTVQDTESDSLSFTASAPGKGTVVVAADGSFVYTPSASARHDAIAVDAPASALTDVFTITVTDAHGGTLALPVSVAVSSAPTDFQWAAYPAGISSGTNVAQGTVGSIPFTYTLITLNGDPLNLTTTPGMYNWGAIPPQYGVPNVSPTIANITASTNLLQFGSPSRPTMAFTSIGNPGTPVSIRFSEPVQILWSQGVTVAEGTADAATVITGREGSTVVQLNQPVTSFRFDYLQNEYYANFAFGASIPLNTAPTGTVTIDSPGANGVVTGQVNATDAESDALSYNASTPGKGSVVVNSDGTFTYTPTVTARHGAAADGAPASALADSFTVTVTDGHGGAVAVPVAVAVSPSNNAPTGTTTANAPSGDGIVTGAVTVTDAESDALSYNASTPGKGSVVVNSDGTFTYTPTVTARHSAAADNAPATDLTDSFTITITDGHGGTATVPVAVTVSPANTNPAGTATTNTPDTNTGQVTGSLTVDDIESDALSYSASTPGKGTVQINTDGTFTYTPTATSRHNASADNAPANDLTDSFSITITDGHGGTAAVPVAVTVSPANTKPAGTATTGSPDPGTGVVIGAVTATDPETDPLSYAGSTTTRRGTVVVNPDGSFTYTPNAKARLASAATSATAADQIDTFTVRITDGYGGTEEVPVVVTVQPADFSSTNDTASTTTGTTDAPESSSAPAVVALSAVAPVVTAVTALSAAAPAAAEPAAAPPAPSAATAAASAATVSTAAGESGAAAGAAAAAKAPGAESAAESTAAEAGANADKAADTKPGASNGPVRQEHAPMTAGKSSGKPFPPSASSSDGPQSDEPYAPGNPAGTLAILGTLLMAAAAGGKSPAAGIKASAK